MSEVAFCSFFCFFWFGLGRAELSVAVWVVEVPRLDLK